MGGDEGGLGVSQILCNNNNNNNDNDDDDEIKRRK